MAKIDMVGLEEVERAMLRREQAAIEAVPEMLRAGAEVLIRAQSEEIRNLNLVDSGDLAASVKATPIKGSGAESAIEVYPQGTDRKGISNATKAFVHQYGKSNLPARTWMTSANAKCSDEVIEAMRRVWEAKNGG